MARKRKFNVTPAEAKACWDSMTNPTIYGLSRRLLATGRPIARQTLYRWQQNGWKTLVVGRPARDSGTELQKSIDVLDETLPILTGDPTSRLSDIVPKTSTLQSLVVHGDTSPVWDGDLIALEKLTDAELTRKFGRDIFVTGSLILKKMQKHIDKLVTKHPEQTAKMFAGIVLALESGTAAYERLRRLNEDNLKVVNPPGTNGDVIEDLADELRAWKAKSA